MKVTIKSGAYGYKENDRFKVAYRGETVDIPDADAKLLISRGEAEKAAPQAAAGAPATDKSGAGSNSPEDLKPENGQETGESGAYSADMSAADLRDAMKQNGLKVKVGMSKAEMAAALNAKAAAEGDGELPADEDEVEDGDTPPDLEAEAPSV